MNTQLKFVLRFIGVFDLYVLIIVEISHDVQNGSGSTLSSMSWQKNQYLQTGMILYNCVSIYDAIIPKKHLFLGFFCCYFELSFIFTKNACFLCELCSDVNVLCSLSLKKTVQNPLWKIQVCPNFVNVILENIWLHKYGANITWCNLAMKGFPLLLLIFIWNYPVSFSVTKFPSENAKFSMGPF